MKAIRLIGTLVEMVIFQPTDRDRADASLIWVDEVPNIEIRVGHSAELHYSPDRGLWVQYTEEPAIDMPEPLPSNEEIRMQREFAYKQESDSLYMAWQKYMAIGEEDKALLSHGQWIAKVQEIDNRFPYNN